MKYIALLALVATAEAIQIRGIDKDDIQQAKASHWRRPWPQGIDDSTDDENVLNWMRKKKEADPPIEYWDKMRQWQHGTWPVYFDWNKKYNHASYAHEIDDGTDDNEVVDVQRKMEMTPLPRHY